MADKSISLSDFTIEDYLAGATSYDVPDKAILRILVRRHISSGSLVCELSERELDLATADLYVWCATTPSAKDSVEDFDGDWKHKEGGWQTSAYDKRQLRQMANDLYAKWDEDTASSSVMRIVNF